MFVQTVHNKKNNLGPETGPVFYWQKHGSVWVGLNEYGEALVQHTTDSNSICNWLSDETVEIIKNPVFKQRILWPRIFIENDTKFVYFEDGTTFYINEEEGVYRNHCHHTKENVYKEHKYCAKEVFGKERQKYVDALNVLGIVRGL